ncbi:acyltransferase family protein [Bacillus haynesii]|uniref:acyltransferase family protein n=1 Tax=Bacillus haynesii TaxID=1925021 RepID=UPI002DBA63FC|nr:acyltransferase family protein [Bacillus haynesii]MEC0788342.1 acyltransferase family protein [Bacillus haynesii]MEC1653648.1 acyltransferase family protein [Bacillus haynesii]
MQVKEIFVIRCISCLSVVLLHAISMVLMVRADMLGDAVFRVVESFRTLLMFSTPAFIFISEFLLAHAYPGGVPEGFLKKRLKTIFIPFLFIAVLDAFMTAGLMMQQFQASVIMKKLLANIFLGNFIGYFILVIFQFYLLHMCFHSFLQKASPKWVLSISFAVTAAYLSYFTFIQPPVVQEEAPFPFSWVPFPGWLFYFCLAYYCGKNYERFLALLERYRHAVYAAAAVTGCFIVAVSFFGQDIGVTSKRPDILLYSTSIIFLCFHLFSKLKSVPKLIMMISNYSFSIYLLHAFILIFGLVILTTLDSIGTVSAVLLLFFISTGAAVFISWAVNKLKYGYMFVGKIYVPKKKRMEQKVRHHAG